MKTWQPKIQKRKKKVVGPIIIATLLVLSLPKFFYYMVTPKPEAKIENIAQAIRYYDRRAYEDSMGGTVYGHDTVYVAYDNSFEGIGDFMILQSKDGLWCKRKYTHEMADTATVGIDIYKVRKSSDWYVTVFCISQLNGARKLEISDMYGSDFVKLSYSYENFYKYCACIQPTEKEYRLNVNGEELRIELKHYA